MRRNTRHYEILRVIVITSNTVINYCSPRKQSSNQSNDNGRVSVVPTISSYGDTVPSSGLIPLVNDVCCCCSATQIPITSTIFSTILSRQNHFLFHLNVINMGDCRTEDLFPPSVPVRKPRVLATGFGPFGKHNANLVIVVVKLGQATKHIKILV